MTERLFPVAKHAVTLSSAKRKVAITCGSLWKLADEFRNPESALASLPHDVQSRISYTVCSVCAAAGDEDQARLFTHFTQPLHTEFQSAMALGADAIQESRVQELVCKSSCVQELVCARARVQELV